MTDYLELLLEPWQEETEEPFVWHKAAVRPFDRERKTGDERETGWRAGKSEETREAERQVQRTEVAAEEQRKDNPAEQLAALERAVARGKVVLEGRVQRLRGTQQSYEVESRGIPRVDSVLPGTRRGLAGLVDAAFERDARRYDGPLSLF